jgi:hypothetical protein
VYAQSKASFNLAIFHLSRDSWAHASPDRAGGIDYEYDDALEQAKTQKHVIVDFTASGVVGKKMASTTYQDNK